MFMLLGILIGIVALLATIWGFVDDVTWAKIAGPAGVVVALILTVIHFNTAEGARALKSWQSNTSGGLERRVEVFDQQGNLIRTYEGKLDVQGNEFGNKVLFDLNGKRTVIYNGTVIVEEK